MNDEAKLPPTRMQRILRRKYKGLHGTSSGGNSVVIQIISNGV
jgi:hypothetical protein